VTSLKQHKKHLMILLMQQWMKDFEEGVGDMKLITR
jgi:hypothetical protein